jgi:hypothetical protein
VVLVLIVLFPLEQQQLLQQNGSVAFLFYMLSVPKSQKREELG